MLILLLNVDRSRSVSRGGTSTPWPLPPPPRPAAPYVHRLVAAAAPALLVAAVFGWASLKRTQKSLPKPWDPPGNAPAKKSNPLRFVFGWLLFIGLSVAIFTLLNHQSPPRPWPTTFVTVQTSTVTFSGTVGVPEPSLEMFDVMLGVVPLVVLFLVFVWIGTRGARRQLEQTWEFQPHLARPETVEATDDGITFMEPLSRRSYDWSYFAGFKETTNLLLLYLSPYAFHVIPKRSFATQADFDVFRGHLLSRVKQGYFLPQTSAFPVIPMAQKHAAGG
jgi:hypothetical protein